MSGLRPDHIALLVACGVPVIGAFLVSSGLFTIDELIYLISAEAMASHRSLTVENGFSQLGSEDLKLILLVDGPNGLTPQYPPGLATLGLPLYAALGARGLILLNALAAAGVAVLTWCLAQKLYRSAAVATVSVMVLTFATFQLDYAWGVWPHMTSAFFVLLSFLLALRAMESADPKPVVLYAILSGLAVGTGLLFRADSILVLPIIAACIFFAGKRPVLTMIGGAIGLVPGLAVAAWVNLHKFGTPNVLSYGRTGSGGGDDINSHLGAAFIIAAVMIAMLLVRSVPWTHTRKIIGLITLVAAALVALAAPSIRTMLFAILEGYMALFVDSRLIEDPRDGVQWADDGTLLFWGVAKKAVFQSLPWLAILTVLFIASWRKEHVRPHVMLLIFVFIWSLPFTALSWHGGFSSSMRYFLPMLPVLVVLSSALMVDLASRTQISLAVTILGMAAGLFFSFLQFEPSETFTDGRLQQSMNLYVFYGLTLVVIGSALLTRLAHASTAPALLAVGFGLGVGGFSSTVVDVTFAQKTRTTNAAVSDLARNLSGPLLIYGSPRAFAFAVERPDVILGVSKSQKHEVDVDLFTRAIGSGYRAVTTLETAEYVRQATGLSYTDLDISPNRTWVEVIAAPAPPD